MNFQEFKDWVLNNHENSNYIANLKMILSSDTILESHMPLFVAGINTFLNGATHLKVKIERKASEWVGNEGEKITFDGVVENVSSFEGYYGITWIYRFRDTDDNVYVWFASRRQNVISDMKVSVRATVKKHDQYKEVKQTIITRAKLDIKENEDDFNS